MVSREIVLTVSEFKNKYLIRNTPVIISGLTNDWPATRKWDHKFFVDTYGAQKVGYMEITNRESNANTYRETDSGKMEVEKIISAINSKGILSNYTLASPIEDFPESIGRDFKWPFYADGYKFKRNRIFIGPEGLVTALHQDLPENFYVVIRGKKHITLYPPTDRKYLYPNSIFTKHPNFSQFNPGNPDYERFPNAKNAHPVEVYLEEGDTLYIPSLWWHYIRNTEKSIAMNFWWSVGWKVGIAWGMATYKKLRNL